MKNEKKSIPQKGNTCVRFPPMFILDWNVNYEQAVSQFIDKCMS